MEMDEKKEVVKSWDEITVEEKIDRLRDFIVKMRHKIRKDFKSLDALMDHSHKPDGSPMVGVWTVDGSDYWAASERKEEKQYLGKTYTTDSNDD